MTTLFALVFILSLTYSCSATAFTVAGIYKDSSCSSPVEMAVIASTCTPSTGTCLASNTTYVRSDCVSSVSTVSSQFGSTAHTGFYLYSDSTCTTPSYVVFYAADGSTCVDYGSDPYKSSKISISGSNLAISQYTTRDCSGTSSPTTLGPINSCRSGSGISAMITGDASRVKGNSLTWVTLMMTILTVSFLG